MIFGVTDTTSASENTAWGVETLVDGSNAVRLMVGGDGQVGIGTTDTAQAMLNVGGGIVPSSNNAFSLGSDPREWADVWATNTTIQSSDATKKRDIADTDLGLAFIQRLRPVKYKWKDSTTPEVTKTRTIRKKRMVEKRVKKVTRYIQEGKCIEAIIWVTEKTQASVKYPIVDENNEPKVDEKGNQLYFHELLWDEVEEIYEESPEIVRTHKRNHYGLIAQEVAEAEAIRGNVEEVVIVGRLVAALGRELHGELADADQKRP